MNRSDKIILSIICAIFALLFFDKILQEPVSQLPYPRMRDPNALPPSTGSGFQNLITAVFWLCGLAYMGMAIVDFKNSKKSPDVKEFTTSIKAFFFSGIFICVLPFIKIALANRLSDMTSLIFGMSAAIGFMAFFAPWVILVLRCERQFWRRKALHFFGILLATPFAVFGVSLMFAILYKLIRAFSEILFLS